MNFEQAQKYIDGLEEKLVKFDLKQITELAAMLRLDTKKLKVIHIAGSNGKGSTATFVSCILKEAGYKTGTYTSPHLVSVTERIRINGSRVSKKEFAKLIGQTSAAEKKMKISPSCFEVLTAAAIKYFLEKKVDFAVMETGLGGRLDATNILDGIVNIITDISLEHTKTLGNTIEKIAFEKAQIIKPNSFCVAGKNNAGIKTIMKTAAEKNAGMVFPAFKKIPATSTEQTFNLLEPFILKGAKIRLTGEFQLQNASLALAATHCLRLLGFKISEKAIRAGLEKIFWAARLQTVQKHPLVVVDATHTPKGAAELKKALRKFEFDRLVLVFSVFEDKNFRQILSHIPFDTLIATKAGSKRALAPEKIKKFFPSAIIEKNIESAIEMAKKLAKKNDMILIAGSIYGAGEALRALKVRVR